MGKTVTRQRCFGYLKNSKIRAIFTKLNERNFLIRNLYKNKIVINFKYFSHILLSIYYVYHFRNNV